MAEPRPGRLAIGERLAALTALVSVLAATALVLAGLARNILAVLAAAASLLACVTGGWYAVSRRGAARLAAAAVIVAALALLVTALVFADISVLRVVIAAVLSVGSVASARYALRRTRAALGPASARFTAAAAPRHPVLIMNLRSGGGKAERFRLAEECRSRGLSRSYSGPATTCSGWPRTRSGAEPT